MARNEDSVDDECSFTEGPATPTDCHLRAIRVIYIYPMFINQLSSVSTTTTGDH